MARLPLLLKNSIPAGIPSALGGTKDMSCSFSCRCSLASCQHPAIPAGEAEKEDVKKEYRISKTLCLWQQHRAMRSQHSSEVVQMMGLCGSQERLEPTTTQVTNRMLPATNPSSLLERMSCSLSNSLMRSLAYSMNIILRNGACKPLTVSYSAHKDYWRGLYRVELCSEVENSEKWERFRLDFNGFPSLGFNLSPHGQI